MDNQEEVMGVDEGALEGDATVEAENAAENAADQISEEEVTEGEAIVDAADEEAV